jgi:Xyloglucan fucosyltransferase
MLLLKVVRAPPSARDCGRDQHSRLLQLLILCVIALIGLVKTVTVLAETSSSEHPLRQVRKVEEAATRLVSAPARRAGLSLNSKGKDSSTDGVMGSALAEPTEEAVASPPTIKNTASLPFSLPQSALSIQNEDRANVKRLQRTYADKDLEPSPAFQQAWERYKRMHNAYTSAMKNNDAKAVRASGMRGSIVVSPAGQLANRVMAPVSSFLLGMLSDRAAYLSFGSGYYASYSDLFESPGIEIEGHGSLGGLGGASYNLPLAEPFPLSEDVLNDLACNDFTKGLGAAGIADGSQAHLTVASNQYFIPLIARNPHYKDTLAEWFPDGDIFGPLVRTLFRPSKAVVEMKEKFKREMKWDEHYVIGLQVRTGGDFTDQPFGDKDWDLLLGCSELMLGLEPKMGHSSITSSSGTVDASARKKAAIFVATDIEWSRDAASQQLSRTGLDVWMYGTFMRSNVPLGCQQALVDILLLSESNDLLTTPWSTFGYLAAGFTRKRPTMLTKLMPPEVLTTTAHQELEASGEMTYQGVKMHVDARTGCARLPTSEPCFHFLPKYHAEKAKCYGTKANLWLEDEFRGGRYC